MPSWEEIKKKLTPWIICPLIFGMSCAFQHLMLGELGGGDSYFAGKKFCGEINNTVQCNRSCNWNDSFAVLNNATNPPCLTRNEYDDCKSCGYLGAVVNLAGGLIVSAVICPSPVAKLYSQPNPPDRPKFHWWHLIAGLLLPLILSLITISYPHAQTFLIAVLFNIGNIGMSLLFDHVGFLAIPKRRVSILQLIVAVLFLLSAVLATIGKFQSIEVNWLTFLPLFAGVIFAFFLALNISASLALPYMTQTSLLNYSVGLPVAVLVWGCVFAGYGEKYENLPTAWSLFPGIIEIFMIMAGFFVIPTMGFTVYQQFFISGQLVAGVFVDLVIKPSETEETALSHALRFSGLSLAIIGALLSLIFASDAEEKEPKGDTKGKLSDVSSTVEPGEESVKPDDIPTKCTSSEMPSTDTPNACV